MNRIDEIFNDMFDELITATEKQRELHTSAFGKDNAQEIIAEAEINRQKIDCWWVLFQNLKSEMTESGLFIDENKSNKRKRSAVSRRSETDTISANSKPVSVTVLGQYKTVRYWKDILLFTCEILYKMNPRRFVDIENEPSLHGRNSPYISDDKNQLRKPKKIEGSPYFVEINLSQAYCMKISRLLLEFFGHTASDMIIEETSKDGILISKEDQ